ncbi:oligosaccharide flippase family protein [Alteromonas sp. A081]|uniref:oligosaccharide flippase family protein n=1 Tax=Alteromonas sp. A081 TaxID=3410269 RepID=UPI003B98114F
MTTARKTILGTYWTVVLNFYTQLATLVVYALLARILTVDEFGLIALCFLITEMMVLFSNFGVNQILIQRRNWSPTLATNCYWFLISLSTFFSALIIFLIAPISDRYFYPNSADLLYWLASIPIINSFSLVSLARLQRNFQNKTIMIVNVIGNTLGGIISIVLVLYDFGVWSVVTGKIIQTICVTTFFIFLDRFTPSHSISLKYMRFIAGFGLPLFFNAGLNFVSQRSINFTTAFILGSSSFALISVSQRAFRMISEVTVTPLNAVLLPGFSRAKARLDLTDVYVQVIKLAACIIMPLYLGLAIVSEELIFLIFGVQWERSAHLLTLLCFTMIPNLIVWFLPSLLISRARTKPVFKANAIATLLKLFLAGIGAFHSIEWSILGLFIANCLMVYIKFKITNQHIEVRLFNSLKAVFPPTFCSVFMFVFSTYIFATISTDLVLIVALFGKIIIGFLIYTLLMFTFFNSYARDVISDLFEKIKS